MRKRHDIPRGTLRRLTVDGRALRDNPLDDPCRRDVLLYVPAGRTGAGLPLLVDLAGFTSSGLAHGNWRGFAEGLPERLDRLIAERLLPPVVVAMPDCFTRLGGNQYVNSPAVGRWEDFLIDDLVPVIERDLGCGGTGRRAVFGKSSGGYGALVHAMRHSDFWSAAACHSGDMGFEWCYLPDMPKTLRTLARYDLSVEGFLTALEDEPRPDGNELDCLMILAMAATYDPDPEAFLGIRLPVDLTTCALIPERWANWLAWDPLTLVDRHAADLGRLKGLFIDCGTEDTYNLLYGARRLHGALTRHGVAHVYEEFAGTHSGIDHRLDSSLPYLAKALAAD